ncbi:unnamed protein product [Schistocephalus solidus]|uniref:WW domain-containing protein n=1 Tax=Schistocephalus solidus TaxID=70667 RepID=A0A183SHC3_SCHSO|nr:unnamed protein product [Schistocephalus solidus]
MVIGQLQSMANVYCAELKHSTETGSANRGAANRKNMQMIEDTGQMILEETSDENFMPTAEELEACAKMLGIDLDKEPYLAKLVHECLTASLPENWKACADQQGNLYYFNFATGDSSWEHPCDALYRRLAMEERRRFSSGTTASNDLETNPPEEVSSSEKVIVPEKSLYMEINGNCDLFDNRKKEDSTGYQSASDDVWSDYKNACREISLPIEEGGHTSDVEYTTQELADDGSRISTNKPGRERTSTEPPHSAKVKIFVQKGTQCEDLTRATM